MDHSGFKIDNLKKISLLLVSLGQDSVNAIAPYLTPEELKHLLAGIAEIKEVKTPELVEVVEEFYDQLNWSLLVDQEKKSNIEQEEVETEKNHDSQDVLNVLKNIEPKQLAEYLQNEPIHSIATMLAYLEPVRCAAIIAELPWDIQSQIFLNFDEVEEDSTNVLKQFGLSKFLVEVLMNLNQETKNSILASLKAEKPDLLEQIENKELSLVHADSTASYTSIGHDES